ncbi:MAG: chemotaxis protein CheX, partial [Oligoflexales bacterium]|nr:chemotaxis protein CheX [Oligoflexales bacterium]
QTLEKVEFNAIAGLLFKHKNFRPSILLSSENYEILNKLVVGINLKGTSQTINKALVYEYLTENISLGQKQIDKRFIKELLSCVVDIISANTAERLEPSEITEIKSIARKQNITSLTAYIGDGITGTFTISTSIQLLNLFTQKMLMCGSNEISNEMRNDVLNELGNQIQGTFRTKLANIGYQMSVSMQTVISSEDDFLFHNKSIGQYYNIIFKHEAGDLDVSFIYGTYDQSGMPKGKVSVRNDACLDVRGVNAIFQAVADVIKVAGIPAVNKKNYRHHRPKNYKSESIHVANARGYHGGYLIALDMPRDTARYLAAEIAGIKDSDITPNVINDICGELLNMINGNYKRLLSDYYGYTFENIFHGDFFSDSKLIYLFRNQGLYFRVGYEINKKPFILCFGMDLIGVPQYYNLWGYLKKQPNFEQQAAAAK